MNERYDVCLCVYNAGCFKNYLHITIMNVCCQGNHKQTPYITIARLALS